MCMDKPVVSIIIPIYNAENYISKCIESVLSQTYSNIEIIVIDDGSTDNTNSIVFKYEHDSRLRHFRKENTGVSDTRNYGIDNSSGDIIIFADADDWLRETLVENVVNYFTTYKCDMVQFNFERVDEFGEILINEKYYEGYTSDKNAIIKLFFSEQIKNSVWNKAFKRELIGDVRFDNSLSIGEDALFCYNCLQKTISLYSTKDSFYYYYLSRESAVRKKFNSKMLEYLSVINLQISDFSNNNEMLSILHRRKLEYLLAIYSRAIQEKADRNDLRIVINELKKDFRSYLKNNSIPVILKFKLLICLSSRMYTVISKKRKQRE